MQLPDMLRVAKMLHFGTLSPQFRRNGVVLDTKRLRTVMMGQTGQMQGERDRGTEMKRAKLS
jgi:hypothetical protein